MAIAPAMPPTFRSASTVPWFVQPRTLPKVTASMFSSEVSSKISEASASVISTKISKHRLTTTFIWSFTARRSAVSVEPLSESSSLSASSVSIVPRRLAKRLSIVLR